MDLNQTLEFIAERLPRMMELQQTVAAAQERADARVSEFVAKVGEYIDRTDARLAHLEDSDAEWRARLARLEENDAEWRARIATVEDRIAELIEALLRDHPDGSKKGG